MYEMLLRCATVTERTSRRPLVRTNEQKRDEFLAALRPTTRCARSASPLRRGAQSLRRNGRHHHTQADLTKMLAMPPPWEIPRQGRRPRAAALQERRASGSAGRWGRDSVTLSDAQVDNLRQIVSSRDPEASSSPGAAVELLARFLAAHRCRNQLVEQRRFPAGVSAPRLRVRLSLRRQQPASAGGLCLPGHCNAGNLPDYSTTRRLPHDRSCWRSTAASCASDDSGNWSQ